jgi:hypothetical protein
MKTITTSLFTVAFLAGCASSPVSTTVEKKNGVTIVHHRQRVGNAAVDKIEAINAKGVVTTAEVHVFDVGRYVDGSGNIHEAHSIYRTVQTPRPNLTLPKTVTGGPRTVYTPPNYVPPPQDQRINDAVAEANQAKQKLEDASKRLNERLAVDNTLAGQLQDAQAANAALQAQLDAAMSAQKQAPAPQTDAQKAALSSVSDLQKWGQQVGGQQ